MPKETSAQVSKLASKYIKFSYDDLCPLVVQSLCQNPNPLDELIDDIQTLAASCLSQDETGSDE